MDAARESHNAEPCAALEHPPRASRSVTAVGTPGRQGRVSGLPAAASGSVVGRVAALVLLAEAGQPRPFPAPGFAAGHAARLHPQLAALAGASMLGGTPARAVGDTDVVDPAARAADGVAAHGSSPGWTAPGRAAPGRTAAARTTPASAARPSVTRHGRQASPTVRQQRNAADPSGRTQSFVDRWLGSEVVTPQPASRSTVGAAPRASADRGWR